MGQNPLIVGAHPHSVRLRLVWCPINKIRNSDVVAFVDRAPHPRPSPGGHGYLYISNRSSFPRKRESRYPTSILDSRWSLPSTRSGAGMTVGCCGAIGRFLQNHWIDELCRYPCPLGEGTGI